MGGYHFVITRDAVLQSIRPIHVRGAHAKGHNHDTIGICLMGGMGEDGKPEKNYTPAQMDRLEQLIRSLLILYPGCDVIGHTDLPGVTKACPVFDAHEWAEQLGLLS